MTEPVRLAARALRGDPDRGRAGRRLPADGAGAHGRGEPDRAGGRLRPGDLLRQGGLHLRVVPRAG
ncbi:hypothetical protein G5V59_16475 [Nocardioides sp. W3-2-3]|uniref:hypothetical protein n=1 Tax=Nocardioides convexus TaxID=2712224 RepID=UPI00241829C2|nr:hypothetical protein [Nocardioides convexus]NHA00958.1 hypothetical protein [Nocardioides convexus]